MARSSGFAGRWLAGSAVLLLAAACGGGGGDAGNSSTPFPALAEDTAPSGARIDVSGRDFFVLNDASLWTYERRFTETSTSTNYTRASAASGRADAPVMVRESVEGQLQQDSFYRVTPAGVVLVNPLRGVAADYPAVAAALPTLLEYPTPFYPQGGVRRVVRQGDLGVDLDGDRSNERFRLEYAQVFLGFQTLQVMERATEVAAFRNTFTFSIYATARQSTTSASNTEDAYFANGGGLVRADRTSTGPDGQPLTPPYQLRLEAATVGGLRLGPDAVASELLPLARRDLVYDATRALYYASVSNADAVNGQRIAVIDSRDGSTTYSRVVGAKPGPLALTADGSALYVGLQGSGDVVKLALPSMAELGRLRLPVEPFNQTQFLPDDISVSPVDADVIAVSMYRSGAYLRHAGIALARHMALAPVRTSPLQGGNLLAFGPGGQWLYSLENEGGGGTLRYYAVQADGLVERQSFPSVNSPYWSSELNLVDGTITVGHLVWSASAPPVQQGYVDQIASHCSKLRGVNKIVCQSWRRYNELLVLDATTLQPLGTAVYDSGASIEDWRVVPGPAGQVAIVNGGRIRLFSHPLLD